MTDNRTLADLAREALAVQNACNLSGVVHGWSRSISRLRELLPDLGTDGYNRHPINQLWASKVHDLTGMGLSDLDAYGKADEECKRLAAG
jgi:hypothetical protein